jgi:hypothetical protein
MKRFGILVSLCLAGSLAFAAPALAAAPGNDTYAGRTIVSVPSSGSVDTTEATTDADDVEVNSPCGAPATDASVWYEVTATSDGAIVVDVSTSTYAAGVIVATGSPGSFSVLACGPGAVAFSTVAGETYAILAFQDFAGPPTGGTLNIVFEAAPPPPVLTATVNPVGRFNSATGSATISGTVTCSGVADFSFVEVQVRQQVGRIIINGFGFIEGFACDGTVQPWSAEVFGDNGVFKGGKAATVTFVVACGSFECGVDFQEHVVQLKGGKR